MLYPNTDSTLKERQKSQKFNRIQTPAELSRQLALAVRDNRWHREHIRFPPPPIQPLACIYFMAGEVAEAGFGAILRQLQPLLRPVA
jgi:hypothetical protein